MSCDCHSGHVTAKARHLRVSKVFSRIFHGSQVRRRMPTYNSACESRIKLYREFQVKLRHTSKQACHVALVKVRKGPRNLDMGKGQGKQVRLTTQGEFVLGRSSHYL